LYTKDMFIPQMALCLMSHRFGRHLDSTLGALIIGKSNEIMR